jgi:hypothetical protein
VFFFDCVVQDIDLIVLFFFYGVLQGMGSFVEAVEDLGNFSLIGVTDY